jgi:hypothetical protein
MPAASPEDAIMRRISNDPFSVAAAVVLLSWPAAPVVAQPTGTATFELPVQTTTVSGGPGQTVGILSGAGSIEHWFAQDRARLFYDVSLDRFRTAEAFDTWLHNAGGVRTFALGKTSVDTGAAVFWRANSGGWADAGFRGINLQSVVERSLQQGTLTAAYNLHRRAFPDAPSLDQTEHYGHVRALVNLQTRTTIVGTAGGGWKRYEGDSVSQVETMLEPGTLRGRRRVTGLLAPVITYGSTGQPARRTLWTWSARLAQSLDDRTGIWIEHQKRQASGDAPPALVWTPPLFYDDGVYDDPYVVEARTWQAGARHLFARGDELAVWVSRSDREFEGLDALDESGIAIGPRADRLLRGGLDVEVALRSTPVVDVMLLAGYGYTRNRSNDSAEIYRSHIASIGLSFRF